MPPPHHHCSQMCPLLAGAILLSGANKLASCSKMISMRNFSDFLHSLRTELQVAKEWVRYI